MIPHDFVLIIAPCPIGVSAVDGWMSRIRAVDRILDGIERVYIDPISTPPPGPPVPCRKSPEVVEYKLDLLKEEHHRFLEDLILKSRFVYVHTVHLARFVLPFYPTGKIVTDMHGIVPEEERLLGREAHGRFYEGVERVVMCNSHIVVVTDAMRRHLVTKHPDTKAQFTILPIIELHPIELSKRRRRVPESRYRAIYSGGTQRWQNIEYMLEIADQAVDFCDFEFVSKEYDAIRARARGRAVENVSTFSVVAKEELPAHYLNADFGFVLRDDVAVNRVACPTKLTEYLWFGVIPIVQSYNIGDFVEAGYRYITAEEFSKGIIPDEVSAQEMREQNRTAIERLLVRFHAGADKLRGLRLPNAVHGNTLAGLPIGQRSLIFPNQAELYMFGATTHYFVRDIIDAYSSLSWTPGVEEPVRALRVIPMLADVVVECVEIDLKVERVDIAALQTRCLTPGISCSEGIFLQKTEPYFELHFSKPVKIDTVEVRWKFVGIGVSGVGVRSEPKQKTVAVVFREASSGNSTKSIVDITSNSC